MISVSTPFFSMSRLLRFIFLLPPSLPSLSSYLRFKLLCVCSFFFLWLEYVFCLFVCLFVWLFVHLDPPRPSILVPLTSRLKAVTPCILHININVWFSFCVFVGFGFWFWFNIPSVLRLIDFQNVFLSFLFSLFSLHFLSFVV